jgi:serine/threonine protein phosphatase 1
VAEGVRVYAFGDVHGRADLLRPLFSAIERQVGRSHLARSVVVGLGDYIDRGGESRAVIEALINGVPGCELVPVRGNHEQMLLDFLEDPKRCGPAWLANGALETLRSYAVEVRKISRLEDDELQAIRASLARNLPPGHLLLLQRLPLSYVSGDYFFAHAGVRPGVGFKDQVARDLLWIRDGFADGDEPFEKVVVHGHMPVDQPYLGRYRINLDTGAYFTNRLSCLVLEGTTVSLLEA